MAHTPENSTVWFELPVADLDRAIDFYSAATGATITKEQMGPDVTAMFKPADPETVAAVAARGARRAAPRLARVAVGALAAPRPGS